MADRIEIVSKDYLGNQLSKYHNEVIKPNYAKSDGSVADESKVWSSNDFTDEMKMNVDQYVSLNNKVDTVASQVNALSTSVADGILPATEDRLGGVIVGENINVDDEGVIATNVIPMSYSDLQDDSDWYDSYKVNDYITDLVAGRVLKGYRDNQVIPDKYNTGYNNKIHVQDSSDTAIYTYYSKTLTELSTSGTLGVKATYQNTSQTLPYFSVDATNNKITLDLSLDSNKDMVHHVRIFNKDFSNYSIEAINASSLNQMIMSRAVYANAQVTCRIIEFRNCKFKSFKFNDLNISSKLRFRFLDCTFTGEVTGNNMNFYNCLFNDNINIYANVHILDSYFADFDTTGSSRGGINAINICSSPNYTTRNILVKNVRFTLPTSKSGSDYINKCVNIMPTNNGTARISIENIIIDIAGKNNTIFHSGKGTYNQSTTMFKGVLLNTMYNPALVFDKTDYFADQIEMDIDNDDSLYVSSIYKESGVNHIICTNPTQTAKTLKVITDINTYTFNIPASITQSQITSGTTFGNGINVDCQISGTIKYAVCYDGKKQIRFYNSDGYTYIYLPTIERNGIGISNVTDSTSVTCNSDTIYDLGTITNNITVTFNIPTNKTGTEIYYGKFTAGASNLSATFKNSDNSSLIIKGTSSNFVIRNEYEFSMLGNVVVIG